MPGTEYHMAKQISTEKRSVKNKTASPSKINATYEKWGLAIILFITFIIYAGSLSNGFCWDDSQNIISNPELRGHSGSSFLKLVTTPYVNAYSPISHLTYWLNYQISQLNPAGYHLTDLILHLISVILLYRFVYLMTKEKMSALIAAAIFALYPIQVESVSWISTRSTRFSVIFMLLTLTIYLRYLREGDKKLLLYAFVLFILDCFSKPSAIVLPMLLFIIDYFENRKIKFQTIIEKVPFFLVTLAFAWLTFHFRKDDASIAQLQDAYSVGQKILISLFSAGYYVFHFIFPFRLTPAYGIPNLERDSFPGEIYPAIITLSLLLIFAIKPGPYRRYFLFALAFYLISLSPVLQIIPFGRDLVADRYTYMPMIGLCLLAGVLIKELIQSYKNKFTTIIVFAFLILAYLSHSMTEIWKNDVTLFEYAISKRPENFFSYYFLGSYYTDAGDAKKAMEYFDVSLKLKPDYVDTYINRAKAISQSGNLDLALADLEKARILSPGNALVYYSRGTLKGMKGDFAGAHQDLDSAIILKPDYADAIFNRGMASMSLKDTASACTDWKRAFSLGSKPAGQMLQEYCP